MYPKVWRRVNENENRSKISITPASRKEADQLFKGLSACGPIKVAISESTWNSYFGMLRH